MVRLGAQSSMLKTSPGPTSLFSRRIATWSTIRAFNVGLTTENYQIREIAEIVKSIVPNSRVEFASDAAPDTRCYRVDCNFISRRLHEFKPQWTARRGVEQLFEAYSATGLTHDEFEGERFKRIAHVQKRIRDGELDEDLRPAFVAAPVDA